MPTGLTCDISKGITFQEFAMRCARQFGACVDMKDEPSDAEIPERFEPSDYHVKKISEAKDRLELLKKMTIEDAEQKAIDEYNEKIESNRTSIEGEDDLKKKYEDILRQVDKWEPPSNAHKGLKRFMAEQIEDSIKWDCDSPYYRKKVEKLSGEEWLNKKLADALHDINYHTKENQEEIERAESRNRWLRLLRESLK